ncbi:MAG: GNAT family N-acetyltransferase [Ferruginibacter sp.]|nr:GNAT family N-acetyltransferase [Ferruginibacter sp.]
MSSIKYFDTAQNHTLENDSVLLRPLNENDIDHLISFAKNEPEIWKFSLVNVSGEEGLKNYIVKAIEQRATGTEYPFIVFDKRTQQYAGSTRFYDIQVANKSLQLGYTWYGKAFQGTGLNKNCKLLLLQFAFEELGMERVEFRADNNNEKSKAAMKSIGCIEEGVLRSHMPYSSGVRRDSIILSILKNEWEGGIKEKLIKKISLYKKKV